MLSAFGVEHGTVSKRKGQMPDWLSGAVPASTAVAYNKSQKRKTKAAASNFAVKTAGGAAGAVAGLVAAGVALKTKRVPKFLMKETTLRKIPLVKKPIVITSGEKKRYVATVVSGGTGGIAGGYAGQKHLDRIKKDPQYGYRRH